MTVSITLYLPSDNPSQENTPLSSEILVDLSTSSHDKPFCLWSLNVAPFKTLPMPKSLSDSGFSLDWSTTFDKTPPSIFTNSILFLKFRSFNSLLASPIAPGLKNSDQVSK